MMTRKARTMKRRLMRESKLGAEYTWDVISTCDQNGLQAIADEEAGEIFIYDPKKRVWATSQTMRMADADIWELVQDQALYDQTMMPARGEKWEQFKAEWNALCNVKNEYPYQKTPRTDPIADEVAESRDFDEDIDNPNDWSASEGDVEIVWDNDFPRFGIEAGDTEPFVVDYDRVDTHDQLLEEVVRLIGEAYPGIEVGTDDFVIDNEDEFWEQRGGNPGKWDDDDLYLESSSSEEEFTVKWIIDDEVLGIEIGDEETVVVDLDYVDSFEELVRQATMELKRNHQGMLFVYDVDWLFPNEEELLKRFGYTMN